MAIALKREPEPCARYVNRELSWLEFNGRVLDQAVDPGRPLLERLKFVAIFGSNLDEFFMIRVSGLHEQLEAGCGVPTPDGMSTSEQLQAIRAKVDADARRATELLSGELFPALARHGIHIESLATLSERMQKWAEHYFRESVFPLLTPLAIDPGPPHADMHGRELRARVE